MLMGKMYKALLKARRQSENNQASISATTAQDWRSWPSQKVLGVCLGLAVCNVFILMLLFAIFVLNNS